MFREMCDSKQCVHQGCDLKPNLHSLLFFFSLLEKWKKKKTGNNFLTTNF